MRGMHVSFGPGGAARWVPAIGVVLLSVVLSASAATWTELGPAPISTGPWTGRCSAVVTSPTHANKWYIGAASGGVWRTLDGGLTWAPLTDHLPAAAIGAMAIDPTNDNIVYAGTGEANFANHCLYGLGVYKTTDGGESWTILAGETFGGRTFSRLQISPTNPQVLFAAVTHAGGFYPTRNAAKNHPGADGPVGVFRSTDGGVTWSHLTNGIPATPAADLVLDPVNPSIVYAALGDVFGREENGIYKSTDGGDSWAELTNGLPTNVGRISLAIAPSNPQRLYAIYTRPSDAFGGGAELIDVLRSDDGGTNWAGTGAANFQATYGWYLSVAIVDPLQADTVFVGGVDLLRSTDGGASWSNRTPGHVDIHGFAYDAAHRLVCANDGGMHVTSDNGEEWFARNDGLGVIQHYAGLSLHPTNRTFVLAGFQDNGTCRRDGGLEWSNRMGGDGGCTALHPLTPNNMFGEYQGTGNLYRSSNGGGSFAYVGGDIAGGDRNCFMPPVIYNRADNSTSVLYATHRIWRSLNSGVNWTAISNDLTGGAPAAVRCLVVAPSDYRRLYAATNDGRVLVSFNTGVSWFVRLTGNPGWPRITRELAVDPASIDTVYLAVSNFGVDQVRKSSNGGTDWTTIDDNLPDIPANAVAVHRAGTFPVVVLGTDNGVYVSFTGEGGWRLLGTNLPNSPAVDLVFQPAFNRLVVGTLGRGTWEIPIPVFADANDDSDVDLADFARFQNCYSGATTDEGFTPPGPECKNLFDLHYDGDVDAADYTAFAARFVGPS
ncbi:MAG TPA: hypothetical protein PKK06_06935 [Phycisphaerae bacterium]|nr:hypothetical protein [Phycisphaerae bacterium]HNU46906.1 hypothetical protein [Phycisphaerae bacterium]